MQRYFALLRQHPGYRNLWLATLVSMTGDWFNLVGTVVLVNRYLHSGTAVAGLFLARMLPPLLFGPLVGVVADRFNRKQILIVSDLLRVLIVASFLLVDSAEKVWLVYVLTVLQFTISAFYDPAQSALTPLLLKDKASLLAANTLGSISWSAMLALGSALGGLTATLFSVQAALLIDALSFLGSAFFLSQISLPSHAPKQESAQETPKGWDEFVAGLRYVAERPQLSIVTVAKAMLQVGSSNLLMTIYASQIFVWGENGAVTFGLFMTASGIGAVLGPILANQWGDSQLRTLQRAITISYILIALSWLLFGVAQSLPIATVAILLRAMGGSTVWTYSNTILQSKTPNPLLGRVFALDNVLITLASSLSLWLTSLALDHFGVDPRHLVLWIAALSLLPVLAWLIGTQEQERPVQSYI